MKQEENNSPQDGECPHCDGSGCKACDARTLDTPLSEKLYPFICHEGNEEVFFKEDVKQTIDRIKERLCVFKKHGCCNECPTCITINEEVGELK